MSVKLNLFLSVSVIGFSLVADAQFQNDVFRQYNDSKLSQGSKQYSLAWTGGVDQAQMAMADLNHDGRNDLVLFHDATGKVKTLIATAPGKYKYESIYEGNFPEVYGYLKLIDMNRDNIPDLIHRHWAGFGIYYGYYEDAQLKFRYYKDLYYYSKGSGWTNAYTSPGTVPGMGDIDGDGDIDMVAYDVWGTLITMYRNCTVEDQLHNDSINVCLKDACWGRTLQTYTRTQLLGYSCDQSGATCKGCGSGQAMGKGTHGNNTITLIDIDNDGDQDYFNGNQDFDDIQFFYNGKSQYGGADSVISQDTSWSPNGIKVHMPLYPTAYVLDVDHDGDVDVTITPTLQNTENYNSVAFYKNVGSNANKNFVFQKNDFLVEDMIDLGTGSYPVLYDVDKDGKKDLLVGSDGYYQYPANYNKSRISYYKNTTTALGSYSFELQTDDFLGLSNLDVRGAALAVGDMDNDTLDDLVIGHTDGTFSFYKNMAASNSVTPDWQLAVDTLIDNSNSKIFDVGDYAAPCLYDIDKDGDMDLISGNQYGDLYYFENIGVQGKAWLQQKSQNLGGVKLYNTNDPYGYSAPYIGTMDDTKADYLVVGTSWGWLYRFTGFQNGSMPAQYTLMDSMYSYIDVGRRSAPAFANLDKDTIGLHELIVGNLLGGLNFFKQDFKVSVRELVAGSKEVVMYPNPARDMININWSKDFTQGDIEVKLVSVTGQLLASQLVKAGGDGTFIRLNDIASGTYYCVVQSGTNRSIQPVTVLK